MEELKNGEKKRIRYNYIVVVRGNPFSYQTRCFVAKEGEFLRREISGVSSDERRYAFKTCEKAKEFLRRIEVRYSITRADVMRQTQRYENNISKILDK